MKDEVLYNYISGEISCREEAEVIEWLEADPEGHQRKLREVRFLYELSLMRGAELPDPKVSDSGMAIPVKALSVRTFGIYALRIAAVVMLVLLTGYFTKVITYNKTYDSISDNINILQVPYGQRVQITLPDGSAVWLNSGARLEYPTIFKKDLRKVKLTGEALFEVEHNAKWPFEVETFATDIRVLGTKFNVVADENFNRFSTALLQGRVKISNRLDPRQQEIIMEPDDVVNLSNGHLFVETLRDTEALCWTEGLVSIGGLRFDELMAKFEQVFDVEIVISRKALPDIGKISGKIRVNDGIEKALHILQYAADFTYERDTETNVVTIY